MLKSILQKIISVSGIDQKHFVSIYRLYYNIINYIKYRDPYMFRIVAIEISTFCNRKCSYCPVSKEEEKIPKLYMEKELFYLLIKQLDDMNFSGTIMYHFYNEPLYDSRLSEFIAYTSQHLPKASSRVFTNGDPLTLEMAKSLFDAGLNDIVVTDHNLKPGKVEKRIKSVLDVYGGKVTINRLFDRAILNRAGSVEVDNLEKKSKKNCTVVYEELNVMYTGDVVLCSSDYHRSKVFGNIKEKSILDIHNDKEFKKAREKIISGVPYYDICKDCNYFA